MCPPKAHCYALMAESNVTPGLAYKVEDRSLLLPAYRALLVSPLLRFIPARVHPNSITHAGHFLNLLGVATLVMMWPRPGWPYIVAAIGVQLYNFCDNADGAHARRTGQCSAMGEFLDHGLDMLNVTYIGYMGALAIGATGLWAMALTLVIPMAACATYWEQAETGVFHLGRLNQIEALTCLSSVLLVTGVFGIEVWDKFALPGLPAVTARVVVMLFVSGVSLFGILHGVWRVKNVRGWSKVTPIVPLAVFNVTAAAVTAVGAGSVVAAVIVGTAGNVFFGLRMLSLRLHGERPRTEYWLGTFTLALAALIAWRLHGRPVGFMSDAWFAAMSGVVFGGLALVHAREGVKRVTLLDASR